MFSLSALHRGPSDTNDPMGLGSGKLDMASQQAGQLSGVGDIFEIHLTLFEEVPDCFLQWGSWEHGHTRLGFTGTVFALKSGEKGSAFYQQGGHLSPHPPDPHIGSPVRARRSLLR